MIAEQMLAIHRRRGAEAPEAIRDFPSNPAGCSASGACPQPIPRRAESGSRCARAVVEFRTQRIWLLAGTGRQTEK
jgi:hypothetical protein